MGAEVPTSPSGAAPSFSRSCVSRRRVRSNSIFRSAAFATARATTSTSSNGFVRQSYASERTAASAVSTVACPVIMMTSTSGRRCFTAERSSRPDSCGILMSSSATSKSSCASRCVAAMGESSATIAQPFCSSSASSARRSVGSSSTTRTRTGLVSVPSAMVRSPRISDQCFGCDAGRSTTKHAPPQGPARRGSSRRGLRRSGSRWRGRARCPSLRLGREERLEDPLRDLRAHAGAAVRDRRARGRGRRGRPRR